VMQLSISRLDSLTILSMILVMSNIHGNILSTEIFKKKDQAISLSQRVSRSVHITCFWDANLMHYLTTGRSAIGILHRINQTPADWYFKIQSMVEAATYGSEFVAGRTATEQVINMHYVLRMMGVPIDGPAYMFGDNKSVITSSMIPHLMLGKRHNILSYHRYREAIATGISNILCHMEDLSDVMTKFLAHAVSYPLVKYFLYWKGHIEVGA
jgi:hypothetical protein